MSGLRITEYGAAQQVPGSKLLVTGPANILIDCGTEFRKGEKQEQLPFNVPSIEQLLITHAHVDHVGRIPQLIKEGFIGDIYATKQTSDLTKIQLIQQATSDYLYNQYIRNRRYKSGPQKGELIPFKQPEYKYKDVTNLMKQFVREEEKQKGMSYRTPITINENTKATFYEAGHLPGSAQILLDIKDKEKNKKILFAYDLGRTDYQITDHPIAETPILKFPDTDLPKNIDAIVIEATNGHREHKPLSESMEILEEAIHDVHKHKGRLILPTMSTAAPFLWNFLYNLEQEGRVPNGFVFHSSNPTAEIFAKNILKHSYNWDKKAHEDFAIEGNTPFNFPKRQRHKKITETMALLDSPLRGYAIDASSAMCNYGRIVSILKKVISDPTTIILQSNYAAPGTRMHQMKNGAKIINFGEPTGEIPCNADIRKMGGLSKHADAKELVAHVKHIHPPTNKKEFHVYIKHGSKRSCEALKQRLINEGYKPEAITIMKKGESYSI